MPSAALLRAQIEAALADRIPSALSPAPRVIRPVASTGIEEIDKLLEGGLPVGAITELVGPESSGRTSLALSFLAQLTKAGKVCAWVDVSNALHPESAAAVCIDLSRLLWVRCGVQVTAPVRLQQSFALPDKYLIPPPTKKGLHGGGFGTHPRNEVKGLSSAVGDLLQSQTFAPHCAEPQPKQRPEKVVLDACVKTPIPKRRERVSLSNKPLSRIDQTLRVTDLLLQGGGFSAVVFDMGSIAPEHASRVPLATWFRYRAAAAQTQTSIVLLTQHSCAKSSGELLLRFRPGVACRNETTVFSGITHSLELVRRRFAQTPTNVVPLRNPPQSATVANWRSRTTWAGGA
jgi:recombination protein RecA